MHKWAWCLAASLLATRCSISLAGVLSDRVGAKRVFGMAMGVRSIFCGATALAGGFVPDGSAFVLAGAIAVLSDADQERPHPA
jgi:MFS family permease